MRDTARGRDVALAQPRFNSQFKKEKSRPGERAQQPRRAAGLPEVPRVQFPAAMLGSSPWPVIPASGHLMPSSDLLGHHAQTHFFKK